MKDLKQTIQATLREFNPETLRESAVGLLDTLGYASDRFPSLPDNSPETFVATIEELSGQEFNRDKALVKEWRAADILFQMQDSDIRQAGSGQLELFDSSDVFNGKAMESYVFAAIHLRNPQYTRTDLAQTTRHVNRLFPMPVIILFVHGETATLAIIERRLNKKDASKDVLEKVTQIKDIRLRNPHRAHIEILNDLALPVLSEKHECRSFVQLHEAWRKILDTNELNKKFYRELADWYFWALEHVDFPHDVEKDSATRKATCVIRLLTRLIFCWFLKEKGLIPDTIFSDSKLKDILKSLDAADSSFYLAILQNLFFGTLNQRMNVGSKTHRRFAKEGTHLENKDEYGVKNLYRYQSLFAISEDDALKLFEGIPFLNGGLFDCLDKENEKGKVLYVDGFTRNPKKRPTVPNFLFFSDYQTLDLSDAYGDKRRKKEKVRGLIHLLESYKFTVTENTPIDEEIALDPELLGKVFENLLASYNPETGTTARKQTGSFYTPREIVNYMVDESLKAYLSEKVAEKVAQTFLSVNKKSVNKKVARTFLSANEESQTGMSVPPLVKTRRNLPHWHKDGSIYWVNFRLADSLPQSKLRAWKEQRDIWKQHHSEPWSEEEWAEYDERFGDKLEAWLDAGMGSCALARDDVREAVQKCLCKFDRERLHLHAAVIMPNHIHALIEPVEGHDLSKLLKGIKGASARQANKILGKTGTFWLDESYDHIVRSQKQYDHFIRYTAENPFKAKLKQHEFWLHKGSTDIPVCVSEGGADIPVCVSEGGADIPVCDAEGEDPQTRMSVLLSQLFSYSDAPVPFDDQEVDALIDAIDSCKILDPACGSGAFPMGILHKLVFILGKLDKGNERWKQKQLDKLDSAPMREELERTFRDNDDDFGRKLYLIENCIYGVDIQPIAIQISKLRFFISLLCDQRTNRDKAKNCGVRPLPNLETKFVAANTLISLDKGQESDGQIMLFDQRLPKLEAELKTVRHKHFAAQRRRDKLALQKKDRELRKQIADVLADDGMSSDAARQLAAWDPYDQNISAPFFDPEWMFGIATGFDVVIGNPPYGIRYRAGADELCFEGAEYARKVPDSYILFMLRGRGLLRAGGEFTFIVPNTFCDLENADVFRRHFLTSVVLWRLWQTGWAFDSSVVDTLVFFAQNNPLLEQQETEILVDDLTYIRSISGFLGNNLAKIDYRNEEEDLRILKKVEKACRPVEEIASVKAGVKMYERGKGNPTQNESTVRQRPYSVTGKCPEGWRPLLRGGHVDRYHLAATDEFVHYGEWLAAPRSPELFESPKILVRRTDDVLRAAIETGRSVAVNSCHIIKFLNKTTDYAAYAYLTACLNSRLLQYYFEHQNPQMVGKTFAEIKVVYVERLPIRPIEFADKAEKAKHDAIVKLVEKIAEAKKTDPDADTSTWESELDARVAHLHNLTECEYETILTDTNTPDDFQTQALEWFGKLMAEGGC